MKKAPFTFCRQNGIRIQLLQEDQLEGAISCLCNAFVQREPMVRHLTINFEEFQVFAKGLCPLLLQADLSLTAVHEETGQVVGVRLSEDYFSGPTHTLSIPGLSPKFEPLFALLDSLSEEFRRHQISAPGNMVHLYMIAVDNRFAGRQIASNMNREFLKLAVERGFQWAVSEPTGLTSQYILRHHLGFSVQNEIKYRDFTFAGRYPFMGLPNHPSAMLMTKSLVTH